MNPVNSPVCHAARSVQSGTVWYSQSRARPRAVRGAMQFSHREMKSIAMQAVDAMMLSDPSRAAAVQGGGTSPPSLLGPHRSPVQPTQQST